MFHKSCNPFRDREMALDLEDSACAKCVRERFSDSKTCSQSRQNKLDY